MTTGTAGRRMLSLWQAMAEHGPGLKALLLDGAAQPQPNVHYPAGDAYDFASHVQFYYHVHRAGEFGHIHLFQRAKGMDRGLASRLASEDANAPCHLVAVGLGPGGEAEELFTTNRWVTGETWFDARAVKAMLPRFRVSARGRLAPVAAWLEALVAFYAPLINQLVDERDRAVAEWGASHPGLDPRDDGGLEITSSHRIDPARDAV